MSKSLFLRIAVISIVAFAVSVPSASGQVGEIRKWIKRVDAHYKALDTLRANVTRETVNPQIGTSDSRNGKIVLLPGEGREFAFRLDWSSPNEILTVAKGRFLLISPGKGIAYTGLADSAKPKTGGAGALKTLSMSEADIRANFTAQLGKEATLRDGTRVAHLILTPLAKNDYTLVDMWVDSDGMPRQIKITLVNRDTDTWYLSQVQKNVRVDRKEFDPAIPKGITVQRV